MTFEKAEKKLLKIAKGRYCTVGYSRTFDEGQVVGQECSLYIDNGEIHQESSWEKAFQSIKPKPVKRKTEKAPKADIK